MRDFWKTALPVELSLGERSNVSDLVDWLDDFMVVIDPSGVPEWCFKDFSLRDEPLVPLLEGRNAEVSVHYAGCFLTSGDSEGRMIRAGLFDRRHQFFPIAVWKVLFSGFERPVLQAGCMNAALNSIVVESDVPEVVNYSRALRECCGNAAGCSVVLERERSEPNLKIVKVDSGDVIWSSEGHPYSSDPLFIEAATQDWSDLLDRLGVPNFISPKEVA